MDVLCPRTFFLPIFSPMRQSIGRAGRYHKHCFSCMVACDMGFHEKAWTHGRSMGGAHCRGLGDGEPVRKKRDGKKGVRRKRWPDVWVAVADAEGPELELERVRSFSLSGDFVRVPSDWSGAPAIQQVQPLPLLVAFPKRRRRTTTSMLYRRHATTAGILTTAKNAAMFTCADACWRLR